ncbi:pentapeptide repeat-containing protein [Synechococcus sp. R60.4]|uniref:pentapeptide repeat-containing protein n=1 Tax=unclassified Synechococcus TaxID=2626047 RepID=UPI0039C19AA1
MLSNSRPLVGTGEGSRPRPWDLVLGGRAAAGGAPAHALVLGGLEGARRRLTQGDEAVRLATLPQLLQYGPAGLAELIEALAGNTSWAVRLEAWRLLSQLEQPEAEEACRTYSPFRPVGGAQGVIVAYRRGERNFAYADLEGVDLQEARLGGANFYEANLRKANLGLCNFNGAHLRQADLRQANLQGAKLSGALLEGADLRGADLRGVKVSGTSLRGSQLSDATHLEERLRHIWQLQNWGGEGQDLAGQDLSKADLRGLVLRQICLRGANLKRADLRGSNLEEADLRGADLQRTDLRGANLQNADLEGADLRGAELRQAQLQGANLRRADLSGANLEQANLEGAQIEGLKHSGARIAGLIFPDGTPLKPWWW